MAFKLQLFVQLVISIMVLYNSSSGLNTPFPSEMCYTSEFFNQTIMYMNNYVYFSLISLIFSPVIILVLIIVNKKGNRTILDANPELRCK
jgi:hypothetical protein